MVKELHPRIDIRILCVVGILSRVKRWEQSWSRPISYRLSIVLSVVHQLWKLKARRIPNKNSKVDCICTVDFHLSILR